MYIVEQLYYLLLQGNHLEFYIKLQEHFGYLLKILSEDILVTWQDENREKLWANTYNSIGVLDSMIDGEFGLDDDFKHKTEHLV